MSSQQSTQQSAPTYQQGQGNAPQGAPGARSADAALLPQGQDRTEQMEYFQSYEANATQTEDDVNQATLQQEFPALDSSLIAAIYSDSKSLSATREMLQELTRES
jgi:hypothetical protein